MAHEDLDVSIEHGRCSFSRSNFATNEIEIERNLSPAQIQIMTGKSESPYIYIYIYGKRTESRLFVSVERISGTTDIAVTEAKFSS